MTIKEGAEEYAGYYMAFSQDTVTDVSASSDYSAFIVGARWMLEKAVNFIRQHDSEMIVCNTEDDNDSFITQFRKAMEE